MSTSPEQQLYELTKDFFVAGRKYEDRGWIAVSGGLVIPPRQRKRLILVDGSRRYGKPFYTLGVFSFDSPHLNEQPLDSATLIEPELARDGLQKNYPKLGAKAIEAVTQTLTVARAEDIPDKHLAFLVGTLDRAVTMAQKN